MDKDQINQVKNTVLSKIDSVVTNISDTIENHRKGVIFGIGLGVFLGGPISGDIILGIVGLSFIIASLFIK